jgi:hypothetical protein
MESHRHPMWFKRHTNAQDKWGDASVDIFESEEDVCEIDLLKDVGKIGELGDFESFEDFLTRDIYKHTVHSGTRI